MAESRVYVENQVLFFPKLENGVTEIGDLWNCHSSRSTGMNIFSNSLRREELSWARVGSSDFQLHQIKKTRDALKTTKLHGEVSLEILAGLIKPEAKFEYNSREEGHSVEETLLLHFREESFKVSTNESAKGRITQDTIRSLGREENHERPTHVVRKILYGGEVRASIQIKSTKAGAQSVANGMAKVNNVRFGPVSVSGRADLAWLDKLDEFDLERSIEVKSMPSVRGAQNTVEDIFRLMDNFQETLRSERHAVLEEVYGVPIHFELVPLNTYLDIKPHLLYLEISSVILNRFQEMLLVQKDFLRHDHVLSFVLRRCPVFEILLQDPTSAFNQRVSQIQATCGAICQRHHLIACKTLEEYKRGGRTPAELEQVIAAFEQEFNLLGVEQELEEIVQSGHEDLPGHQTAATASLVRYFTSLGQVETWWEDNLGLKVLLTTSNGDHQETQPKAVQSLLRLAGKFSAHQNAANKVGIIVPSCGQPLELKLKCLDKEEVYSRDVDWMLKCLECLLTGHPAEYETKFLAMANSRKLPLDLKHIRDLPSILFLSARYSKVIIADSFYDLTKEIRQATEKWQFVATLEGVYSADEVLHTLRSCLDMVPEAVRQDSAWIVGTFEKNDLDTPLLFIFRDGCLAAVCLDHLDILVLAQSLRKNPESPDLEQLSIQQIAVKPLNRFRAQFALDVRSAMEDQPSNERLNPLDHFPDCNDQGVVTSLVVLSLAVGGSQWRRRLFKIIASHTVKSVPELSVTLQPFLTWDNASDIADTRFLQQAGEILTSWLRTNYSALGVAWNALRSLKSGSPDQFAQATKLIQEFPPNFPKQLKLQIESRKDRLGLEEAASTLHEDIQTWLGEAAAKDGAASTVMDLLKFLEAEEGSPDIMKLCEPLVCAGSLPDEKVRETISSKWKACDLYSCLNFLAKYRLNPALVKLEKHLGNLSVMTASKMSAGSKSSMIALLTDMYSTNVFSADMLGELWLNPRFRIFMTDVICDNQDLLGIICRHYGKRSSIPAHLPQQIRTKLEQNLSMLEKHQYTALVDSTEELEAVLASILQANDMSDNFTTWLAKCLESNDDLRRRLETLGGEALPSWNKAGRYFEAVWGLDSVRKSYNCLMNARAVPKPTRPQRLQAQASADVFDIKSLSVAQEMQMAPKYQILIGEPHRKITLKKWTEINELLPQPKLVSEALCPVAAVIPYTMQKLKMWGHSVLSGDHINKYWTDCGATNALDDADEENESPFADDPFADDDEGSSVNQKRPTKSPLSRLDILTVLLQSCEPFVQEELFRILTQFPISVPVVVPSLQVEGVYDCLLPLLTCGIQKWEQSSTSGRHSIENRILVDPFHLILTIRLGKSPRYGKSTILNQLYQPKHMFSSASEPGAEFGPPISLSGLVELTWLTEETVVSSLWTEHLKAWYNQRPELILLANLHGDVLEHPAAVALLSQLASHVLVFLMPDEKSVHKDQLERLKSLLNPKVASRDGFIGHVFVNSRYKVADAHCFHTDQLIDDGNMARIRKKIGNALKCDSHSCTLDTLKPNNTIRMRNETVSTPLSALMEYIRSNSCAHMRKTMSLQQLPRTTEAETQALAMWKSSTALQHIISLFAEILHLGMSERVLALAQLEKAMSQVSGAESEMARRKVLQHKAELNILITNSTSTPKEKSDKQDLVRQCYEDVDSKSLGLEHFFRELGRIQEINALESLPGMKSDRRLHVDGLARRYAELLLSGQSIELLDGDAGELNASWISAICSATAKLVPNIKIFVLSILGLQSSGKSTLLNALFACKFSVSVGRCTRGLFMRLLFLDEGLRKAYGTDAMLIIDTEGLGAPEKMNDPESEKKDRLMATFAMAISNLTIVNVLGEYLVEMKNILQISVVALTRLELARMSPDILMVQHLTERNIGRGSEGVDAFCQALNVAIELTKDDAGGIGVQNSTSIEKLMRRAQTKDIVQQFRPFKSGASPNSPPSQQYHEDVMELQQKILSSARELLNKSTFEDWHSVLPDLWRAMKNEDFATRFKDIKDMSDFIRRGQDVAKVKILIDAAMYQHAEMERQYVLGEFTRRKQEQHHDPRHWKEINAQNEKEVHGLIEIHLGEIPFRCAYHVEKKGQCDKCLAVSNEVNKSLGKIAEPAVKRNSEETIRKYIERVRVEHGQALKQRYSTILFKDRMTESFDQMIDAQLKAFLTNATEGDKREMKSSKRRGEIVADIWTNVARSVAAQSKVEGVDDRIQREVDDVFGMYTNLLEAFMARRIPDIDQQPKKSSENKSSNKSILSWAGSKLKGVFSSVFLTNSSGEAMWLMNELRCLPKKILAERGADRYISGMVRALRQLCDQVFVQFQLHHPNSSFKITEQYKIKCYLFALLAFLEEMQNAEEEWKKENHGLTVLKRKEKHYKEYIDSRLLFGFSFSSEGNILASHIVECAIVEAVKSVQMGAAKRILSHPWILNAENVRLKYFEEMAQQVQTGDNEWALKHFANPRVAITTWFDNCIESEESTEQYREKKFLPVYKEKLEALKTGILNETSCQDAINVAKEYILNSLEKDYTCSQDLSKAKASDFQHFKQAFEDELKSAKEPQLPIFKPLLSSQRVSKRLGCTEYCKWCGALCWGEFGHAENAGDLANHNSSHQIGGLHGVSYHGTGHLVVTKCDERKDESFVLFGAKKENGDREFHMTWKEAKAHEFYKDWNYIKHYKSEFNDLMTWFFIKLNTDIAKEGDLKPPLPDEMAGVKMDSTLADILATIRTAIAAEDDA